MDTKKASKQKIEAESEPEQAQLPGLKTQTKSSAQDVQHKNLVDAAELKQKVENRKAKFISTSAIRQSHAHNFEH